MSPRWNIAVFVLGVAIIAIFYGYAINNTNPLLFFDPERSSEAIREVPMSRVVSSVLAMILGIIFGALYEQLRARQSVPSFQREVKRLFQSARFVRAFLAAPIVFVGVYLASRSNPDPVVSLIFAFQNGFFCESIMRSGGQEK